jgi:hypothetical protein
MLRTRNCFVSCFRDLVDPMLIKWTTYIHTYLSKYACRIIQIVTGSHETRICPYAYFVRLCIHQWMLCIMFVHDNVRLGEESVSISLGDIGTTYLPTCTQDKVKTADEARCFEDWKNLTRRRQFRILLEKNLEYVVDIIR